MFSDIGTWASVGFVKLLLVKLLLNDWVVEGLPLGNARFCKDDAVGLNMKLLQSMLAVQYRSQAVRRLLPIILRLRRWACRAVSGLLRK